MENSLFNDKTIQSLSENINLTAKQKKSAKIWLDLMDKGELKNEKKNYLKFYDIILRDLLGYDDIKFEENNVEFTYVKNGKRMIRIETKGMDTKDLFKKQIHRNNPESPVEQLWRYMNQFATPYGIVTNYKIFILFKYSAGSLKYYLFDFEDIKKNQNKLKEFVAIFSKESIDSEFVEKVYEKSIIEERDFTKEFYKLYHETRLMMMKEFKENSPEISDEGAIHFSQLFLNRLMFIFFAEDTGKLERRTIENKILELLKNVNLFSSNSNNISNSIVSLFNDLDKGSDFPTKIFGFNGGLFKHPIPPKIYFRDFRNDRFFKGVRQHFKLNKELNLNQNEKVIFNKFKNKLNPLIKNILLMASFDFKSEVNVNILGHIFEQSVSDLEDLKDKKTSRRKKEGIFYTPEYITDYICRNTIIPYLSKNGADNINDLLKEYSDNLQELEDKFKSTKILDPACGSGAFLIKAVDVMLEIFKAIQEYKENSGKYEAQRGLKRKSNIDGQSTLKKWNEQGEIREIIENNIYGVDINEESVEITKLSLFLKIATKNKKLIDLSEKIKQGNSLIDDKEIAGKLAFDWDKEFPEIIKKDGFDIVIGNPPYVRADVDDTNYKKQREWVIKKGDYKTLYEKWDLYLAFIERGLSLLSNKGNFSMIIPDAFCTAKYSLKMREYLSKNKQVNQVDYYPNDYIFEGVGVKNIILFVENINPTRKTNKIIHKDIVKIDKVLKIDLKESGQDGFRLNYKDNKRLYEDSELLGDICFVSVGMVLNANELTAKGEFKKDDLISEKEDNIHPKKYVEAKNIQRYLTRDIKYLEWGTKRVPKKIRRPTFKELYEGEKLIFGGMTGATYDDEEIMHNHSIFTIKKFVDLKSIKNKSIESSIKKWNKKQRIELEGLSKDFNLKYILSILNSKWAIDFLKSISRNKLGFYPDDIKQLPIKKITLEEQKPFIEKADLMLKLNKEFYDKKSKFLILLKHEYNLKKLSKKLENFYLLEFDDFMKELEKISKKQTSKEDKLEWINIFDKNKKELLDLRGQIDKIDNEINEMVNKLYN